MREKMSLERMNDHRRILGLDPVPVAVWNCTSPASGRRYRVCAFNPKDTTPALVISRMERGWRVRKSVLIECGIDDLNPGGFFAFADLDPHPGQTQNQAAYCERMYRKHIDILTN